MLICCVGCVDCFFSAALPYNGTTYVGTLHFGTAERTWSGWQRWHKISETQHNCGVLEKKMCKTIFNMCTCMFLIVLWSSCMWLVRERNSSSNDQIKGKNLHFVIFLLLATWIFDATLRPIVTNDQHFWQQWFQIICFPKNWGQGWKKHFLHQIFSLSSILIGEFGSLAMTHQKKKMINN